MDHPNIFGYQITLKMVDLSFLWEISGGYDSMRNWTWQKAIYTVALLWLDYFISSGYLRSSLHISSLSLTIQHEKFEVYTLSKKFTWWQTPKTSRKLDNNPPRCSTAIPFHPSIQDTKVHGGNSAAPKLFRHTKPLGGTCKEPRNQGTQRCLPGVINIHTLESLTVGYLKYPKMMVFLKGISGFKYGHFWVSILNSGGVLLTHCYLSHSPMYIPIFSENFSQCLGCVLWEFWIDLAPNGEVWIFTFWKIWIGGCFAASGFGSMARSRLRLVRVNDSLRKYWKKNCKS